MPLIRPPRFEGSIELGGDRRLGYAEWGPASGRTVIWLHGTPGARRQIPPEAREIAGERDVRIIAVERPGIGASTPHRYRTIRDFADDIEQLCESLDVERFGVVALSGGAPYALACAHEMPERVVAAVLLGGVAPAVGDDAVPGGISELSRLFSPILGLTHGPLDLAMRGVVRALQPFAQQAVDTFASIMPPGDKLLFEDQGIREMFIDDLVRGSRTHMQAIFLDMILFGRHWGFALGDVEVPVHLLYGDADNIVPFAHGEHMARILPQAILRQRKEEGHLGGLGASHEIIEAVMGHWDEARGRVRRICP